MAPTTQPILKPDLPQSGLLCTSMQGDDFDSTGLRLQWHFLDRKAAASYSLTTRKGWIRLRPDGGRTHLVQKEIGHYYTAVTRVEMDATDTAARAGIYLTNGNQQETARLYTGYNKGRRIIFRLDTAIRNVPNTAGKTVWLKLERKWHDLTAYYSRDGKRWLPLGASISAVDLDRTQPNFNSWVGASLGVFAEGRPADFDFFTCKDAFSPLPAYSYSNYYAIRKIPQAGKEAVTNTSAVGGWLMIPGIETGQHNPSAVELTIAAKDSGRLEIWLDDLRQGTQLATVPINASGGQWKTLSVPVRAFKGHHDLFVKYRQGTAGSIYIQSLRFIQ
jgi:hypothetical protein